MDTLRRYHVTYSVEGAPELVPDPKGALCLYSDVLEQRGCPPEPPRPNIAYGVLLAVLFAVFFIGLGLVGGSARCHP